MIASPRALAILGATLALGTAACGGTRANAAPDDQTPLALTDAQRARIHVAAVVDTTFHPSVEVTGTVAFNGERSTQVLSQISGPVTKILVDVGAHVVAGQALAFVASPDFSTDIAAYRRAEAAWVNATRIANRDSALFANDALARQELEQAQTDAAGAAADRDAALDDLRSLGVDSMTIANIRAGRPVTSGQGVVRAPIGGTVVEKLLTPGQLLAAGTTPCFTIADMGTVWVMGSVFEANLGDVAVGDAAVARPSVAGRVFQGQVTYVGALVDPDTRATAVRIVTPNPGEYLKKDMFVRVTIDSRRARAGLLVPESSVLRDQENIPFVFVTTARGGFERRAVTLGSHMRERYEITAGLTKADRVVAEGALFLQFAESQ